MFLEHLQQPVLSFVVFLQREQWPYFVENKLSINASSLADQNPFNVQPILRTARKCLQHHQIFRRAGDQRQIRWNRERTQTGF